MDTAENKNNILTTSTDDLKRRAIEQIIIPNWKKDFEKEKVIRIKENTIIHLSEKILLYCPVCKTEFFDEIRTDNIIKLKCKGCKSDFYIRADMMIRVSEV